MLRLALPNPSGPIIYTAAHHKTEVRPKSKFIIAGASIQLSEHYGSIFLTRRSSDLISNGRQIHIRTRGREERVISPVSQ